MLQHDKGCPCTERFHHCHTIFSIHIESISQTLSSQCDEVISSESVLVRPYPISLTTTVSFLCNNNNYVFNHSDSKPTHSFPSHNTEKGVFPFDDLHDLHLRVSLTRGFMLSLDFCRQKCCTFLPLVLPPLTLHLLH